MTTTDKTAEQLAAIRARRQATPEYQFQDIRDALIPLAKSLYLGLTALHYKDVSPEGLATIRASVLQQPADIDYLLSLVATLQGEVARLRGDLCRAYSLFGQNEIEALNRLPHDDDPCGDGGVS